MCFISVKLNKHNRQEKKEEMAASIMMAVYDISDRSDRQANKSNEEMLKDVLEWNYRGFTENMWDIMRWGKRPIFSRIKMADIVQLYANRAMQLYQQWQWLTRRKSTVYWSVLPVTLEAVNFQVIAKIMSTEYDFNVQQRLSESAFMFEQAILALDEMAPRYQPDEEDDGDELIVDIDNQMVNDVIRNVFYDLMMRPQNYVKSALTTDISVLVTANQVHVAQNATQQTSTTATNTIDNNRHRSKRSRADME
jgi:hypothetical protein